VVHLRAAIAETAFTGEAFGDHVDYMFIKQISIDNQIYLKTEVINKENDWVEAWMRGLDFRFYFFFF
jgi:hypothetical protein